MLGKLPVPGRPTIWITVGQGPTALAVGAGGGCLDTFTLIYPFSPLSPSLWETARYRLKYCLKGPLNPKQPTNQSLPKRGRKRKERTDERKNVQTTPTRTYCKRSRPLPYCYPNCSTPRYWKFTQHHRTTRPRLIGNELKYESIQEVRLRNDKLCSTIMELCMSFMYDKDFPSSLSYLDASINGQLLTKA